MSDEIKTEATIGWKRCSRKCAGEQGAKRSADLQVNFGTRGGIVAGSP